MLSLRPRPWMPLLRRRAAAGFTTVPRTTRLALRSEDGPPRPASLPAPPRWRGLLRWTPSPRELQLRIDELAAEAEAWVAELEENARRDRSLR